MVQLKSNANNELHLLYFSDIVNVPSGVQMTLFIQVQCTCSLTCACLFNASLSTDLQLASHLACLGAYCTAITI